MFNVAVFDQNREHLRQIESYLTAFLFDECEFTIYTFETEDDLIEFIDSNNIILNLICLDADSKSNIGFSAAEYIRKINVKVNIIFITNDRAGLEKGYKYNAFDYLLKPVKVSDLSETISRLFFYIDNSKSYFYIKIGRNIERYSESTILYFASTARKVTLFTVDGGVDFYAKMDDVYEQLDQSVFIRIHQSYIVNLNHINKISKNHVYMDDNEILPISKKYCEGIKDIFN